MWHTAVEAVTESGHPGGVNRQRDGMPVGTVVAAYEIEALLGAGGFGVVYRARHQPLDSVVALKEYYPAELAVREGITVHPRRADYREAFDEGLRRFREEAKRLIELRNHPAIVGCRDFFLANGTAYLVMEYVDGEPLSSLLLARERAGRPFGETDLRAVIEPLLDGLGRVHSAGVIHRDIKPSNILIQRVDERPLLIDFGAAKQTVAEHTKSFAPYTNGFAAMEQLAGGELGPWTDLYAIGAVMWRMVAGGHSSLDSPSPARVERRASAQLRGVADPLPPVRRLGWGRFSEPVLTAIEDCLQLNATDRPQACSEVLESLRRIPQPVVYQSPGPQTAVPPEPIRPRSKSNRSVVFPFLIVVAVLGLASLPFLLLLAVHEPPVEREGVSSEGQETPQPNPIPPKSGNGPEGEHSQQRQPDPNGPRRGASPEPERLRPRPDPPKPRNNEEPRAEELTPPEGETRPGNPPQSGEIVSSPRLLDKVEPSYSEEAREVGLQGTVRLAVEIWEDGLAHNIRVLRSLGLGLDEKAVEAVRQWKFSPGRKDGNPVKVAAQIHVTFRIVPSETASLLRPIPLNNEQENKNTLNIDRAFNVEVQSPPNSEHDPLAESGRSGRKAPLLATGTEVDIRLVDPLGSGFSNPGDHFRAHVVRPLNLADGSIIPVGSVAVGQVVEVQPAKRQSGRARLSLTLVRIEFEGQQHSIVTEPVVIEADGTKKQDAAKVAIAAGSGAIIGGVLGGKQGAARGATIGGAAGVTGVLVSKGKEVELDAEDLIQFRSTMDLPQPR